MRIRATRRTGSEGDSWMALYLQVLGWRGARDPRLPAWRLTLTSDSLLSLTSDLIYTPPTQQYTCPPYLTQCTHSHCLSYNNVNTHNKQSTIVVSTYQVLLYNKLSKPHPVIFHMLENSRDSNIIILWDYIPLII